MIQENYQFIAHHIQTCRTYEQLRTCERMIEGRIVNWGAFSMANDLINMIELRMFELIAFVHQTVED
jgi:hypothetical protein